MMVPKGYYETELPCALENNETYPPHQIHPPKVKHKTPNWDRISWISLLILLVATIAWYWIMGRPKPIVTPVHDTIFDTVQIAINEEAENTPMEPVVNEVPTYTINIGNFKGGELSVDVDYTLNIREQGYPTPGLWKIDDAVYPAAFKLGKEKQGSTITIEYVVKGQVIASRKVNVKK